MKPSEQWAEIKKMLKEIEETMLDPDRDEPRALPYYYDPRTNLMLKHPWHYVFFSQFKWYRRLIGGRWTHLDETIWVRCK